MADSDLNLFTALDALLAEGSVASAARRLGLSASAMSRTLARLREATGDPLLVRAGRSMVPTPPAAKLRERVRDLAQDARAVLRPNGAGLDLMTLKRRFTLRSNDDFVEIFTARIVAAATNAAPGGRLHTPKPDKDARVLREGLVDLEIGVLGTSGPEVRFASPVPRPLHFRSTGGSPVARTPEDHRRGLRRHRKDHGVTNVAPAPRRRFRAPLAPRPGAGPLRRTGAGVLSMKRFNGDRCPR